MVTERDYQNGYTLLERFLQVAKLNQGKFEEEDKKKNIFYLEKTLHILSALAWGDKQIILKSKITVTH